MARFTITQKEIETRIEKALENACAFHAIGKYKLMYEYRGMAEAWLDFLEDNGIWYDSATINDHVQEMLDILDEENYRIKAERI